MVIKWLLFLKKQRLLNVIILGFLLPPEQIIPTGLETFEALKALAFFIMQQKNL